MPIVSQFVATSGVFIDGVMILNGTLDTNGTANGLILDSDGDTSLGASTNDQIDVTIGGALDFTLTANSLNVLAGSAIGGTNSTFVSFAPIAAQQALSGAGTINISSLYTAFTSTGAGNALSLANATVKGHTKIIMHVVDGGSGILTPTSLSGGTTITFTTVGEIAELTWSGTAWVPTRLYNTVTPGTPPVLA